MKPERLKAEFIPTRRMFDADGRKITNEEFEAACDKYVKEWAKRNGIDNQKVWDSFLARIAARRLTRGL